MSEIPTSRDHDIPQPEQAASKLSKIIKTVVFNSIGVLFWVYAIGKLLIYDFDTYLVDTYWPSAAWIIKFKILAVGASLILGFIFFRSAAILGFLAFVLLYPIILTFWIIPKYVFKTKRFVLGFSLISFLVTGIKGIRYSVTVATLYLAAFILIYYSHQRYILVGAASTLACLLLVTYAKSILSVFHPASLFASYKGFLSKMSGNFAKTYDQQPEEIRTLPVSRLNEDQLAQRANLLGAHVILTRASLFSAKVLKEYQNSGVTVIAGVFEVLRLIAVTTVVYAGINCALFKVDHAFFQISAMPTNFTFIYFSFKAIIFSTIPELLPIAFPSQLVSMAENATAPFLVGIFVTLTLSIRSQRYSRELDEIIQTFENESRAMETVICNQFRLQTLDDAIAELRRLEYRFLNVIIFLTR